MHYCFYSTGTWYRNASFGRFRDLGTEFLRRGVRVTYLLDDLPFNRSDVKLPDGAAIEFAGPANGLKQFAARRRILRHIRPDYLHILNPSPKAYLTLRPLARQKLIVDWDEWPAERARPTPVKHWCLRLIERYFRRRAHLRIVCSKHMQTQFAARFGQQALYLPYATYLDAQPDVPSPYPEPTAVYMGSLYVGYDHDIAFRAADLLKQRGLTPRLEFVGGGPDLEPWRRFVRDHHLDNVTLTDYVPTDDMWARIRHAHILLFPIRPTPGNLSRCPAKTYAFAQARRPVITCRIGEVPEVLGEHPQYIDPTPDAFADAIAAAMLLPQPDVDYDIERHNWAARADTLLEALSTGHRRSEDSGNR